MQRRGKLPLKLSVLSPAMFMCPKGGVRVGEPQNVVNFGCVSGTLLGEGLWGRVRWYPWLGQLVGKAANASAMRHVLGLAEVVTCPGYSLVSSEPVQRSSAISVTLMIDYSTFPVASGCICIL